jgi:hypothetical protein
MAKPKVISARFQVMHDNVAYTIEFNQTFVVVSNHRWKATLRQAYPPSILSCEKLINKFVTHSS